jgi:glycosyltransferase involved in cell wall biosynthesis
MKVLAVTNLFPRPDQPRRGMFNAQLFASMAEQGVDFTLLVLVPEWRLWRWPLIRKWMSPFQLSAFSSQPFFVPVMHLPIIGRNLAWRFHLRALRRHKKLFEAADAVLATWLYPDAVAAGIVARECGKPFWVKPHGTDRFHMEHPTRGAKIREVLQHAAGFLPNAQFLANYLVERGVPAEKVDVVRHGVDHELFRPRPREEAIKALQKMEPQMNADVRRWELEKTILFVGNLEPIKGPDRLLHAYAHVKEKAEVEPERAADMTGTSPMPPVSGLRSQLSALIFIGDGSWRGRLEQMAKDLDVADDIVFLGDRPHEEVALWMNIADVLCLPSRSEGMPNVVIEALASGCPVVATDVGDVKWLLKEGANGYVVGNTESGVVDGLAAGLGSVLDRSWDRGAISDAIRELTWEHAAEQVMERLGA